MINVMLIDDHNGDSVQMLMEETQQFLVLMHLIFYLYLYLYQN